jgi:hypothetical protein
MDVILPPKRHLSAAIWLIVMLGIGVIIGASFFRSFEPRSLLAWNSCTEASCLRLNEITGLAAAVGLKYAPGLVPLVVRETPYSIVIRHPKTRSLCTAIPGQQGTWLKRTEETCPNNYTNSKHNNQPNSGRKMALRRQNHIHNGIWDSAANPLFCQ